MSCNADFSDEGCGLSGIEEWISCGSLILNCNRNCVYLNRHHVRLQEYEYKVLLFLMKNQNRIVTVRDVFESVWQTPFVYSSISTVLGTTLRLQRKIESDLKDPKYVRIVWEKGFIFQTEDYETAYQADLRTGSINR